MKHITVLLTLIFIILSGFNNLSIKASPVVYLKNDKIVVGVLVDVGGRIVEARTLQGNNILKSDSALWSEPLFKRPQISTKQKFKAYNGSIIWLGPQNDWWLNQNIDASKRNAKDVWPPDPYLIYGKYEIIEQSDTSLKIFSPESLVSGIKLIKEIKLDGNSIIIKVEAINIRAENVSWDIWFNTRLDGMSKFYVPTEKNGIKKVSNRKGRRNDSIPYSIEDGYFTFHPQKPLRKKRQGVSKAYIHPKTALIAAFNESQALFITFEKHQRETIHPEQALVEVYNFITFDGKANLLELEHHAPFCTLAPGESMKASEVWHIFNYKKKSSEHIPFVNGFLDEDN